MKVMALRCPICGAMVSPQTMKCEYCGAHLILQDNVLTVKQKVSLHEISCPSCKKVLAELPSDIMRCPYCGFDIEPFFMPIEESYDILLEAYQIVYSGDKARRMLEYDLEKLKKEGIARDQAIRELLRAEMYGFRG